MRIDDVSSCKMYFQMIFFCPGIGKMGEFHTNIYEERKQPIRML
jgi:hypothetical protein